jgi:hypothetical protein
MQGQLQHKGLPAAGRNHQDTTSRRSFNTRVHRQPCGSHHDRRAAALPGTYLRRFYNVKGHLALKEKQQEAGAGVGREEAGAGDGRDEDEAGGARDELWSSNSGDARALRQNTLNDSFEIKIQ